MTNLNINDIICVLSEAGEEGIIDAPTFVSLLTKFNMAMVTASVPALPHPVEGTARQPIPLDPQRGRIKRTPGPGNANSAEPTDADRKEVTVAGSKGNLSICCNPDGVDCCE